MNGGVEEGPVSSEHHGGDKVVQENGSFANSGEQVGVAPQSHVRRFSISLAPDVPSTLIWMDGQTAEPGSSTDPARSAPSAAARLPPTPALVGG